MCSKGDGCAEASLNYEAQDKWKQYSGTIFTKCNEDVKIDCFAERQL